MAQESPFRPISDDEYAKLFNTLKRTSDLDTIIRNGIIQPILNKYADKAIDVMSVGAGIGWLEDEIIRHPNLKINSILAIEPNQKHAEKLKEKSLNWKYTTSNIDTSYFSENYDTEMRFDVILMVHSIYYLENPTDAIIKLKSFLKDGGQVMIDVRGEKSGFELVKCMQEYLKIPTSTCIYGSLYHAGMLIEDLKENDIKYQKQEYMASIDVSEFIERKPTPFSNDCVSFLLHTRYENLDKELQEEIYKIVRNRVTVTEDNRFMFGQSNSFIYMENV